MIETANEGDDPSGQGRYGLRSMCHGYMTPARARETFSRKAA